MKTGNKDHSSDQKKDRIGSFRWREAEVMLKRLTRVYQRMKKASG